jgi:hypothetical protein
VLQTLGLACPPVQQYRVVAKHFPPVTLYPVLKAILTDEHFWIPVAVLGFGLALLVILR